jgi:hypothetical protein
MAAKFREQIAELEADRALLPRSERKPINQRLHMVRGLLRWCETRAGYRS